VSRVRQAAGLSVGNPQRPPVGDKPGTLVNQYSNRSAGGGDHPLADSDELFQHFGDQGRVVLYLQGLNLVRRQTDFFQIADQALPDGRSLLTFGKVQFGHLFHRLLQRDRIPIAVIVLDYLFLVLRAWFGQRRAPSGG